MNTFITSEGVTKTKEELKEALKVVAQEERELSKAIRSEDNYASHVTEQRKDEMLKKGLQLADDIENGQIKLSAFWLWQKINKVFTGECVAFLGK